jgi:hypothetical protein
VRCDAGAVCCVIMMNVDNFAYYYKHVRIVSYCPRPQAVSQPLMNWWLFESYNIPSKTIYIVHMQHSPSLCQECAQSRSCHLQWCPYSQCSPHKSIQLLVNRIELKQDWLLENIASISRKTTPLTLFPNSEFQNSFHLHLKFLPIPTWVLNKSIPGESPQCLLLLLLYRSHSLISRALSWHLYHA